MNRITALVGAAILAGSLFAAWEFGFLASVPSPGSSAGNAGAQSTKGQATPVVTRTVTKELFTVRKRTIGFVEPMAQVAIKTRFDSQILTQNVRDGAMVNAGDVLFTLDDRELKAQIARDEAQIARDRATIVRTQADLQRKIELNQKGVATPQAYDQAVADNDVAKATLAADEAALQFDKTKLDYTVIRAPISGRAGAVNVTPGNLVKTSDTGPALVTITQIDPIRVAMQLSEQEFGKLQTLVAQHTPPEVTIYRSGTTKVLVKGQLSFIDSAIDVASGTVTIKAEFANGASVLWPGMFVDADVILESTPDSIVVPTVAVQTGPKGPYVFVLKADQTVEIRPVTVAALDGTRTAIETGLSAGERVVVEGQGRLSGGSKVSETPSPQPQSNPGPIATGG